MGTRGILAFVIKGQVRGCYNHWDSYPTGMGLAIMRFLKSLSEEDIEKMIKNLEKIEWVDEKQQPSQELQDRYITAGFFRSHMGSMKIRCGSPEDWYNLLYNTRCGRCLPFILDGTLGHLLEDDDVWGEEWNYIIDFEKRTLDIEGRWYDGVWTAKFEELSLEFAIEVENWGISKEDLTAKVKDWKEKEALRTDNYTKPDPNFYSDTENNDDEISEDQSSEEESSDAVRSDVDAEGHEN